MSNSNGFFAKSRKARHPDHDDAITCYAQSIGVALSRFLHSFRDSNPIILLRIAQKLTRPENLQKLRTASAPTQTGRTDLGGDRARGIIASRTHTDMHKPYDFLIIF